jgi:hypothetical protein
MNWNPQQPFPPQAQPGAFPGQQQAPSFAQPQQPPAGAVPQYGTPPGQFPAPPAYGQPQPAPAPAYGSPYGQAAPGPQGFGPPQPPPGYAPQQPVAFNAAPPSLENRNPNIPLGSHIVVATGEVECVGQQGSLFVVGFNTERSSDPNVPPGSPCAFKRDLAPKFQWSQQKASDEIGRMIVGLLGLDPKATLPQQVQGLINELVQRKTLNGRPIAGLRAVVTATHKTDRQTHQPKFSQSGEPVCNLNWAKAP